MSRECLYYHLYAQTRVLRDVIERLEQEPEIRALLSRGDLAILWWPTEPVPLRRGTGVIARHRHGSLPCLQ